MSGSSIRSLRFILASGSALAVAACADSGAPLTAPSPGVSASRSPELNSRHLFHTKQYYASNAANHARTSGTGISYHGGPLIASPATTSVAAIYWGASQVYPNAPTPGTAGASAGDGSLIGHFLRNLGGSPYFNINTTYTLGTSSTSAHVANVVTYTQYWANASVPNSAPTDADMANMLAQGFASGALTYDANTVYAIFTGPNVNLGGGFITQYCAYHTHATVNVGGVAKVVLYAAMPHNADNLSACSGGYKSPNNDIAADAEVNTLAHEIEETTTDELGSAWYDSRGYENADKCAWTFGATYATANGGTANMNLGGKDFLVQQNWVNAGSGGCTLKY